MYKGKEGFSNHKHYVVGHGHKGKSPRIAYSMKREAEKAEIKRVRIQQPAETVRELLERRKKKK